MLTIVDTGVANIGSLTARLSYLDIPWKVAESAQDIERTQGLIIPGVGSFDSAMKALNARNLMSSIYRVAEEGSKPILGICLGMQLMMESSAEGSTPGLNLVGGRVERLATFEKLPHIGWNWTRLDVDDPLLGMKEGEVGKFYFSHSYCVRPQSSQDIVGTTSYGVSFPSVIRSKNIWGLQFHPECSHGMGSSIFVNLWKLASGDISGN